VRRTLARVLTETPRRHRPNPRPRSVTWAARAAPRRRRDHAVIGIGPKTLRGGDTVGRVEEIDRRIVTLLAKDGRMSFTDLARETGLSVSAVHQRVRRLERRGVIRGYAALIDYAAVGLPLTAFVSIKPIDPAAPDDAPQRLEHLRELESCHSVAGDESYILKVRVASPQALEDLLQRIRAAANVSTRTTVVLSTPYEHRAPDLFATETPD
jgi:Transcriptional regulators